MAGRYYPEELSQENIILSNMSRPGEDLNRNTTNTEENESIVDMDGTVDGNLDETVDVNSDTSLYIPQPNTTNIDTVPVNSENFYSGGRHPIKINETTYMIGDKLATTLRQTYINWNTFHEIYKDSIDDDNLFQQVVSMFHLNTSEKLKPHIVQLLHKIYHLSSLHHISCMIKQFVIKEPISMVIYNIFRIFKQYFESLVTKFMVLRNQYILQYGLAVDGKVLMNEIEYLQDKWNELNDKHSYDTSSTILYFLSHPHKDAMILYNILDTTQVQKTTRTPKTHSKTSMIADKSVVADHSVGDKSIVYTPYVPSTTNDVKKDTSERSKKYKEIFNKIQQAIDKLVKAINQFEYVGFCPKRPFERLMSLLKFPVDEFQEVISLLSDDFHPVNMKNLFRDITKNLSYIAKPTIKEIKERDTLPKGLNHRDKICWYVKAILDLRKSLLPEGKKIEQYYMKFAHILTKILSIVKKYIHLK